MKSGATGSAETLMCKGTHNLAAVASANYHQTLIILINCDINKLSQTTSFALPSLSVRAGIWLMNLVHK